MSLIRRLLPAALVAAGALVSLGAQAATPTFDDLAHPDSYKFVSHDTTDSWVSSNSFSSGAQTTDTVMHGLEGLNQFDTANTASVTTPIPEPQTYALMLAGIGVLLMVALRRRRID